MKKCNICGMEKSLTAFACNKAKPDGLQGNCSDCGKAKNKEWYSRNKAHKLRYSATSKKKKADLYWKRIQPVYDAGCQQCGEKDIATLEFHHVEKKQFDICVMIHCGHSWQKVLEELKKCVCVCANCHRKAHYYKLSLVSLPRCSEMVSEPEVVEGPACEAGN